MPDSPPDLERLYTVAEFGEATNTSERFARRLVATKRIRYIKVGKFVRIPHSAITEYLDANRVQTQ